MVVSNEYKKLLHVKISFFLLKYQTLKCANTTMNILQFCDKMEYIHCSDQFPK